MKKNILFYTLLLGSLFLCSCGSAGSDDSTAAHADNSDTENDDDTSKDTLFKIEAEAASAPATNVEEQLSLIAENASLWLGNMEGCYYLYAITDLDCNGRLEIITSTCQGTGLYTYSQIYEVNEALDTLLLCETDWTEGDSQPDITVASVPVYYDFEHNVYLYVFDDMIKCSAAEYYENKQTLSLQNKQIVSCLLATRTTVCSEGTDEPEITCTLEINDECFQSVPETESTFWDNHEQDDAGDSQDETTQDSSFSSISITNEEYENAADTVLCAYEKKTATLNWMGYDYEETKDMEYETLYHMLKQSYEGFAIQ